MVGIKLDGRLGNQLFQFAFIYTIAKKLNTSFYIDKLPHRIQFFTYFDLKGYGWLTHAWNYTKGSTLKFLKIIQLSDSTPPRDHILYKGFFQSENYFYGYEHDIQSLFEIKKKYVAQFNHKYSELFSANKTLVIHIRRTDYLTHGGAELGGPGVELPFSFYEKAIKEFSNSGPLTIIVIGDDMSFARQHFAQYPSVSFEQNSLIVDFQLMLNADNLIISNSTFAWWAAWLNKKKPRVIAPMYWMGFKVGKEYPEEIICKSWEQLAV